MLAKKHLSKKKRSQRSEKRCAIIVGGKVQPASGAIDRFDLKGDVKSARFLIDDKTTHAGSFAVNLKLWRKLSNEAWKNRKRPAIRIEFSEGAPLYVIEEINFLEYLRLLENKEE